MPSALALARHAQQVVTDLLDPSNTNLKIHEALQDQIVVAGLSEKIVVSPEEMLTYMHEGLFGAAPRPTLMPEWQATRTGTPAAPR